MKNTGQLRIIAGLWRHRLIRFPVTKYLRPTPDSMRETLFNWLQASIAGSHCLDLFAGSGALGFEAASRGAGAVCLVENNRKVADALYRNCENLGTTQVSVQQSHALKFLNHCQDYYDIIFLDPPYCSNLLQASIKKLKHSPFNKKSCLIYIETNYSDRLVIDSTWRIIQYKQCGQVHSFLIQT